MLEGVGGWTKQESQSGSETPSSDEQHLKRSQWRPSTNIVIICEVKIYNDYFISSKVYTVSKCPGKNLKNIHL